jgi:hypothetical protein
MCHCLMVKCLQRCFKHQICKLISLCAIFVWGVWLLWASLLKCEEYLEWLSNYQLLKRDCLVKFGCYGKQMTHEVLLLNFSFYSNSPSQMRFGSDLTPLVGCWFLSMGVQVHSLYTSCGISHRQSRALLSAWSMHISCLAYSSTLKMEATCSLKNRLTFNGLDGVISQKIELCNTIAHCLYQKFKIMI